MSRWHPPLVFCLEKRLEPMGGVELPWLGVACGVAGMPMAGPGAEPGSSESLGGGTLGTDLSSASGSVFFHDFVASSHTICVVDEAMDNFKVCLSVRLEFKPRKIFYLHSWPNNTIKQIFCVSETYFSCNFHSVWYMHWCRINKMIGLQLQISNHDSLMGSCHRAASFHF